MQINSESTDESTDAESTGEAVACRAQQECVLED